MVEKHLLKTTHTSFFSVLRLFLIKGSRNTNENVRTWRLAEHFDETSCHLHEYKVGIQWETSKESLCKFFVGNRFHVTLGIASPWICKQR